MKEINLSTFQLINLFRHWIKALPTPRVTPTNTLQAQPSAFQHAPLIDGIHHVMGATRVEIALRTQNGRNCQLVEPNGEDEYFFEQAVESHGNLKCNLQNVKVIKLETLGQVERMSE